MPEVITTSRNWENALERYSDELDYDVFVYVKKIDLVQIAIIGGISIGCIALAYGITKTKRPKYVKKRG